MNKLRLVVDNTKPSPDLLQVRAQTLLGEIAANPGGAAMLRGLISLMAPKDAQGTVDLVRHLIQGADTGQVESVIRVLETYRNLPVPARP